MQEIKVISAKILFPFKYVRFYDSVTFILLHITNKAFLHLFRIRKKSIQVILLHRNALIKTIFSELMKFHQKHSFSNKCDASG